ncbi:MAG TPA: sigma-54 dependent transcriptional regulator [Pyrinomonadaceae bacterium]|jgi:DNA-binding NtrC family response regulator|nr:sigma-54 dependent transcriptional regulator [Pyrinomonadaceae bacterium]
MSIEIQALVIDDEPAIRGFVSDVLREDGWQVAEAETAEHAFDLLRERHWSLVFCDVLLGGADGVAVLRRFVSEQPHAKVVLMTGHGSAAGALDATAFGAYDYLLKPFGINEVLNIAGDVRRQLETKKAQRRTAADTHEDDRAAPAYTSDIDLVGRSAAFLEVMKLVGRVAPTNLPVLITGESGTGKEVVARAIHRRSARASEPFVAVNCGALPSELIESELFGHVRGSFTGAERDRRGLWEEADGGTVFLDEITETTLSFQVKLLRALQEGEIRRVGSNRTVQLDVRVIAATNRDVEEEVRTGRFRQDLLYRLNAVTINLPALRERRADIPALARRFAERVRPAASSDAPVSFTRETLRILENYAWPGNIRELENAVVRAAALCDHTVRPEDLPERILRTREPAPHEDAPASHQETRADADGEHAAAGATGAAEAEWTTLAEVEARYVRRVLEHTHGNKQAAARLLGVDRKTLQRMIQRHNITTHNHDHSAHHTGRG